MSNKDDQKREKELARQRAKQEAEEAKRLRKLVTMAKKEEEAAAKVKARINAQAAEERAKHEAEEAKKAKVAAAKAKKEEKAIAKARAREEAEAAKKAKVAAAKAKKEEKAAAKAMAREEAEAAKKAREAALLAKKEEEAAAKVIEKQEVAEVSKVSEGTKRNERKDSRKVYSMVPLFSWRSLLVLTLGVMVGAGMGLAYWIVSPSFSSNNEVPTYGQSSFAKMIGQTSEDVPWTSKVTVQIVNPGTSYMALRDLQSTGEYYVAKTSSLPFLQFLSEELDKTAPEYYHTVDVLDQMITTGYKYDSEQPAIEITVTAETAQEATFLTANIPEVFKDFLISEETAKQDQEYMNTENKIDFVKSTIVEAEYELNVIKQGANSNSIVNDPVYVALSAKIDALENELNRQAMAMALNVVDGNTTTTNETIAVEYDQTLQQIAVVNAALAVAENQLKALELKYSVDENITDDADHVVLNAKVRALEQELNRLMAGDSVTTGLASMIAEGVTYTQDYKDTMTLVDRTSLALVEAKNEIAVLESQAGVDTAMATDVEYQLALAKVDNMKLELVTLTQKLTLLSPANATEGSKSGTEEAFNRVSSALADAKQQRYILEQENADSNRIEENLDYLFAQAKVDNLNAELARLTQKLTSMLGDNSGLTTVSDYLVAGTPSIPLPELPERMRIRNALIMGALLGVAISWIALNFRWIGRVLSTNSETDAKTGEDD